MIFVLLPERFAADAACPFGTRSDRLSVSFSKDSSVHSLRPFGHLRVLLLRSQIALHFLRTSYGSCSICDDYSTSFSLLQVFLKNFAKKKQKKPKNEKTPAFAGVFHSIGRDREIEIGVWIRLFGKEHKAGTVAREGFACFCFHGLPLFQTGMESWKADTKNARKPSGQSAVSSRPVSPRRTSLLVP